MEDVAHYHSQGAIKAERLTENGGKDPVFGVWAWKRTTAAHFDGRDQM